MKMEMTMDLMKLKDIDMKGLTEGRKFHPSPQAWEDQVLYFLMLDRFSDGNEKGGYRDIGGSHVTTGSTPLYTPADNANAIGTEEDAERWREAGACWVGGNLKGLMGKLGYLRRLGVTAVWISPIFKQVSFQPTYHGYGIQNFIYVDRKFGDKEGLRELVRKAHENGIYVILDIILNHSGNVFAYDINRYETKDEKTGRIYLDPRWDGNEYEVKGFMDASGVPGISFADNGPDGHQGAWPDGAVWPVEFQKPQVYTKKGHISNWEYYPEYLEGDFCDLKDITLGGGPTDHYRPSEALRALAEVYKFWIAYADVDGFRVDTVKHMDPGATRFFTSCIHEFAQDIGKENFYLIGEITGGRGFAVNTMEETGLNAALGIADIPDKLEYMVKGWRNPEEYFGLFRNSMQVMKESHVWFRDKVVTVLDDHDQVRKGQNKARFCADEEGKKLAFAVLALNATTLGIPCIYYGTEQAFDGQGGNDRYIREAMFGGEFGAFRSRGRHFFDEGSALYRELSKVLEIRKSRIALRRGRQYLREISGDGEHFGIPCMMGGRLRSIVAWSRIFNEREVLLAINTDCQNPLTCHVIVDGGLNGVGERFRCIYSTDGGQVGSDLAVGEPKPMARAVWLTVPAAGFVIYEQA